MKVAFKYLERLILPILATIIIIDFWETINKAILVLLFLYLLLSVLEKLGLEIKFLNKMKITKLGKFFIRLIRSSNPVTQYSSEQVEETSELIANSLIEGKNQLKKIKEEVKMKKRFKALLLIMKHNKAIVTGYVLAVMYVLESIFHWASKFGIPTEALPYIAVFIVGFIFYVMFGEGFTFNDVNEIREEAIQAKKIALASIGKTQSEYNKNKGRVDELSDMFKDNIPAEYAEEWSMLHLKLDKLKQALDLLNEDLDNAKKIIKNGK